ncbi:sialidase family protein [Gaoshiqia sp. Z1-71]|uniref:sialidase family protein n=1 Tax=Gaoshiqia hydrogeniformans TaxID=3290090 RepID=UPI003BF782CF
MKDICHITGIYTHSVYVILTFLLFTTFLSQAKDRRKTIDPDFQKSVVWEARENNADGYRIPGIVVTTKGTALAFAEERLLYGDADPKSLVVKRSIDDGFSWSESIYVEKCDGSFWSENQDQITPSDSKEKKEVWTNICPLIDRETGRIFFFYALSEGKVAGKNLQRYTRLFYKTSDDDGLNWSERVELTNMMKVKADGLPNVDKNGKLRTDANGFPCDFMGRSFHMPGPGHGIQLSNGRLLLPVWSRTALAVAGKGEIPVEERKYGLGTIYSDDHGMSWKFGSAFGHDGWNMNESRLAELRNGDVYINARYVNPASAGRNNQRIVAKSQDGGVYWGDIHIDKNFPQSNPCDAGLVSLEKGNNRLLLYSKNESTDGRKNLVVRVSFNDGKSWPVVKVVDEGSAGYSDMAALPDQTVLLIYETGKNSPVYCIRLNPDWMNEPIN